MAVFATSMIRTGKQAFFLPPGKTPEIAGMERFLEHWRDLDNREPTLKIICPSDYESSRKQYGLFRKGCPNLLWELRRTRREQLSASQLMRKNPTEAIVDKDNHLRDALKYILLSSPTASEIPAAVTWDEIVKEAFATGTQGTLAVRMAQLEAKERAKYEPISYRDRWPRRGTPEFAVRGWGSRLYFRSSSHSL